MTDVSKRANGHTNGNGNLDDATKPRPGGQVSSQTSSPTPDKSAAESTSAVNGLSGMKIQIPFVEDAGHNGSINSVLNGTTTSTEDPNFSPEAYGDDPIMASALMSPMHEINWDAALANAMPGVLKQGDAAKAANDWEVYKRAGPPYPPSLEKLIMSHHQKHCNSWQLAHDLGAGSGVFASNLATYFRHIHTTDPIPTGINATRQALSEWTSKNPKKRGRFTFSVSGAEDSDQAFAEGTVDLAIIAEGAHFTDAEATVRSVARTLTPNGTLAIVTRRPLCSVVGNERANAAVQRLFEAWGPHPWTVATGTSGSAPQQFSLGLDFVPLPAELFARDKTKRILINSYDQGREAFRVPGLDSETFSFEDAGMDLAVSRVDAQERRYNFGEANEQGRGWRQEVGWESFRTRVALIEKGNKAVLAKLEPHFKEIERVIAETSPNGVHVVVEWAAAVVLATRTKT